MIILIIDNSNIQNIQLNFLLVKKNYKSILWQQKI